MTASGQRQGTSDADEQKGNDMFAFVFRVEQREIDEHKVFLFPYLRSSSNISQGDDGNDTFRESMEKRADCDINR